jgi:hypothetical protein
LRKWRHRRWQLAGSDEPVEQAVKDCGHRGPNTWAPADLHVIGVQARQRGLAHPDKFPASLTKRQALGAVVFLPHTVPSFSVVFDHEPQLPVQVIDPVATTLGQGKASVELAATQQDSQFRRQKLFNA